MTCYDLHRLPLMLRRQKMLEKHIEQKLVQAVKKQVGLHLNLYVPDLMECQTAWCYYQMGRWHLWN